MRFSNLPGRLLLIVSAAILPLAIVCAFALQALFKDQTAQTRASTLGVARAVATAIDAELGRTIAALQVLALNETLAGPDGLDLGRARAQAEAVKAAHPEWRAVLLATPDGEIVVSSEHREGPSDVVVEKTSHEQVLQGGAPVVGPMAQGPRGNSGFPVRVPVMRHGVVRYVLTAIVRPEALTAVLQRQSVPEGWTVSVFDSNRARVARNVGDDRLRGTAPSDSLRLLMQSMGQRAEFVGSATTVDGVRVQTALARADTAPWTVALGASVSTAEHDRSRTLLAYGGGLLGSMCLGLLAAWWLSRAVTTPMARLRRDADALGSGGVVEPVPCGIPEIDAVGEALAAAAIQRSRGESEREKLLEAERVARSAALEAGQRLEWLVGVSTALSRSLEEQSTLSAIAELVVPDIADLCRIDLLDRNGVLERKLTHHFDPESGARIAQMVSTRTAPSDAQGSFPYAIATGKTFLVNLTDPAMPEVGDPALREFARVVGITAACVVPLVARGRTIGAMAILQADSGRQFSADDGLLIGELAQRAALALDNVRLFSDARAAQEQAEAANRAKDEFLAMLGHELRNPLAPIALALQLISRRDAQAFPKERQIIERQVKHLSRMVDDLLDVSRIIAGKIELALENVDLCQVVARAVELTTPAMQQRTLPVSTLLPPEPVFVHGDPLRLAQIVSNLLTNASKFTAADRRIEVSLSLEGSEAALAVTDEGIGISADLLPHVFERFVQGTQHLQRASGGLGLGLAIARSLARMHGGTIQATSEGEGKGSRFVLRLPLLARVESTGSDAAMPSGAGARLQLLLVDDNLDALRMLADWCELEGHAVVAVGSAEAALVELEARRFDAGIFDIGLPAMNGHELARRVRADARHASMALVALTGYGQEKDRQRAMKAGFDDHFAKPADIDRILQKLIEIARRLRT